MSCHLSGINHPKWKGGISKDRDGYLRIKAGPLRDKMAHRAYMERILGRELRSDEEVHHVCRNRACWPPTDFHLCLMSAALHAGLESVNAARQHQQQHRQRRRSQTTSRPF